MAECMSNKSQTISSDFESAANHLVTLLPKLSQEQMLAFYGLFKQSKEGPCNIPKPGFFDFQGKQKWSSWKALGEMSSQEAMTKYVEEILKLDPDWNPSQTEKKNHFGPAFSIMANTDSILEEKEKTVFDFVKDGNLDKLNELSRGPGFDPNLKDSEGLALLHWACDRGHVKVIRLLLKCPGVQIDVKDPGDQTPLHYASSCGHREAAVVLLENKADAKALDEDGLAPKDVALNKELEDLF